MLATLRTAQNCNTMSNFKDINGGSIIRLTKEFSFEAAHFLGGYDGLCRYIHGHSYRLFVTVKGVAAADISSPKCGMVLDFKELKSIVSEEIISRMDHAMVVRKGEDLGTMLGAEFSNITIVEYQPTCENMIVDFAHRIAKRLPASVELHSLKLYETATSFAEWFAEDNTI